MESDSSLLAEVLILRLNAANASRKDAEAGVSSALPADVRKLETLTGKERERLEREADEVVRSCGGNVEQALASVQRTIGPSGIPRSWKIAGCDTAIGGWLLEAPGRYIGERMHARGGMGRVVLVHDTLLGRNVALKELLPELSGTPGPTAGPHHLTPGRTPAPALHRFFLEARIAGRLEHPSIVPVYEIGHRRDGTPYYTMRHVRGRTLAAVLRDTTTLRERLALLPHFLNLCEAIAYAHSRGIIHRDIHPGNVMVGEFGETVVIDWGLAKVVHQNEDLPADGQEPAESSSERAEAEAFRTVYGHAFGTPPYIAPEQARGDLARIDERSDVYSLGVILYELLSGRRPFAKSTLREILDKIVSEPPPPMRSLEPMAPPELIAICERAISKRPEARYESAKALAEEIERFQAGAIVSAYVYRRRDHLVRFIRKYKPFVATGAVAAVLLVGLTAFYVRNLVTTNRELAAARDREIQRRQEAEEESYRASILLAQAALEKGSVRTAREAISSAPPNLRNWEWGYLLRRAYPERLTLTGHTADVTSAVFRADGTCVLTASGDGTARLWSADSGNLLFTLKGHTGGVRSAVLSEDDTRVLTASTDATARIWDVATGKSVATLTGHRDQVMSAVFSPDGWQILTTSADGSARVWDARSGEGRFALQGHRRVVRTGCWDSHGKRIVTASEDGTARVWDASTGVSLFVLTGHTKAVRTAVFSPDNHLIATASDDETAKLWDAGTGAERVTLSGHTGEVLSAMFRSDGLQVVTASADATARVWDTATGKELLRLTGHSSRVLSALFSPNDAYLLTCSWDNTARLWDARDGAEQARFAGHDGYVAAAGFDAAGGRVVTASIDGTAKIWGLDAGAEKPAFAEHSGDMWCGAFSPDGKRVVTGGGDRTARVWDLETGRVILTLTGHGAGIRSAAFSPDALRIVTASADKTARIWDAQTGQELLALPGHAGTVRNVAFTPDGARLATASEDRTVRIWDAATGEPLRTIEGHKDLVCGAAFSPDGARIVTASKDRTARIWDVATGEVLLTFIGHKEIVRTAMFDPSGARVVSTSDDMTAILWDATYGTPITTLRGHTDGVHSAAFSPNGERIVTASADTTVKVWNARTGYELLTLTGHTHIVRGACFSPDGTRILSVSADGAARLWEAWPGGNKPSTTDLSHPDQATVQRRAKQRTTPDSAEESSLSSQ